MNVLVTGGTGLLGNALKEVKPDWTYIGSADCNLFHKQEFSNFLLSNGPFDFVIHLAANVGGLFKNMGNKVQMFQDNVRINENVLESCHDARIPRVICCLSTCVFPDGLDRSMHESDLHNGLPHSSNFGYAYAKRMLDVHCRLINEEDSFFYYQSIIPTNLYGPYDRFDDPLNAHVIPSLICRAAALSSIEEDTLVIKGTGLPIRQFIFSLDLARIITIMVHNDIRVERLICAPDCGDECTISYVAHLIAKDFGLTHVKPEEEDQEGVSNDGQQTKICSNNKLRSLLPDFEFVPLEKGIKMTCNWYRKYVMPHTPKSFIDFDIKDVKDQDQL